jgi:predicted nucleic acid-binding Zn ribbon protein
MSSDKKRKSDFSMVGEAMGDMLRNYKLEDKYNESRLIADWEKIMGPMIANRTTRLYIKDQTLFVTVNSAPLRHELTLSRDKILQRLEEETGKKVVHEIVIR